MIGSGVPAGAEKPFQDENSKPGKRLCDGRNVGRGADPLRGADGEQP